MVNPSLRTDDLLTGAQIRSSNPGVPLDSLINANVLSSGDKYNEIMKILDKDNVKMFDLKLYSNSLGGNLTKLPNGTFEVRLPVPSELEGKSLVVYYVNSDGKVEEHEVTVKEGYAVFTTNHFSIYTLTVKGVNEVNPKTYDSVLIWAILGTVSLIGLAGVTVYKKKLNLK